MFHEAYSDGVKFALAPLMSLLADSALPFSRFHCKRRCVSAKKLKMIPQILLVGMCGTRGINVLGGLGALLFNSESPQL
jgi:hypothetical protein